MREDKCHNSTTKVMMLMKKRGKHVNHQLLYPTSLVVVYWKVCLAASLAGERLLLKCLLQSQLVLHLIRMQVSLVVGQQLVELVQMLVLLMRRVLKKH